MNFDIWALGGALLAIAVVFIWTIRTGSPPTPTSPAARRAMLAILPRHLPRVFTEDKPGAIYELGAGWGGMALALARQYPDDSVAGVELAPVPWLVAKCRSMMPGHGNLEIRYGDFHASDLSDAGLVVCYLSADGLARLKPKLEDELPKGALVLSNTFAMPGWRRTDETAAGDIYHSPVYLYEMSDDMTEEDRGAVVATEGKPARRNRP